MDRTSKMPLDRQRHAVLCASITGGAGRPDDMIPPESELVAHYQVGRTSVRPVLDRLVEDGLIIRRRGRGGLWPTPPSNRG